MNKSIFDEGIYAGRCSKDEIAVNFSDLHVPLDQHEALVAADRCYFCHDAPCMTACPTAIDIPLFIRQISTGTPEAAAKTILNQNILGGMCARVCPTETLCEQACVRETAEKKPVLIGQLQRFATDIVMEKNIHPFSRAKSTGKKIAIIGAGPAGLSCAHRLAMHGHDIVIFEARPKPGGLNEYGIAAYKTTNDFAAREVEWLLQIGGIAIRYGQALDGLNAIEKLQSTYDAIFLGIGLGAVNVLGIEGEEKNGSEDAVEFIRNIRQASDLTKQPIGRDIVVIGGGMTAVDTAIQAKALGALNVSLVYRRSRSKMNASQYEQDLAASKGVRIITNATPVSISGDGHVSEVEFAFTDDNLKPNGERIRLAADQVFKAVGQKLEGSDLPTIAGGKINVDASGKTNLDKVWAGGDCASGGEDLTVTAVAQGRDAAENIHAFLTA